GDLLYNALSAMISRQSTQDGWYSGFNDDYKRIYYVKRLNPNAVLVVSIYSVELENIVDTPDSMTSMTVRLIDKDMNIIYSSLGENKTVVPREIRARIKGDPVEADKAEYIVSADPCGDDWFLVTSIPTEVILDTKKEAQKSILTLAVIATLIAIVIDVVISIIFTNPINHIVSALGKKADYDQLTGVLNKRSFEDGTRYTIANAKKSVHAMVIVDIDDFKSINDSLGHTVGDHVLSMMGELLNKQFTDKDLIGRIGGDEFCVFTKLEGYDNAWSELSEKCEVIRQLFNYKYADDKQKYRLSCSIGAALFPFDADTFEELYINADKALYISKRSGKNTASLYGEKDRAATGEASEAAEDQKDETAPAEDPDNTENTDSTADGPSETVSDDTAPDDASADTESKTDNDAEDGVTDITDDAEDDTAPEDMQVDAEEDADAETDDADPPAADTSDEETEKGDDDE
ncbi:MAG: diguanylate cyclase, partial [Oscillospiraceae bacterium]|nr:diguanylate cyclase [Oscillospiraceae bacterium]